MSGIADCGEKTGGMIERGHIGLNTTYGAQQIDFGPAMYRMTQTSAVLFFRSFVDSATTVQGQDQAHESSLAKDGNHMVSLSRTDVQWEP